MVADIPRVGRHRGDHGHSQGAGALLRGRQRAAGQLQGDQGHRQLQRELSSLSSRHPSRCSRGTTTYFSLRTYVLLLIAHGYSILL